MNQQQVSESASILWHTWMQSALIDELPQHCRPTNRSEGYAIQAEIARLSKQTQFGWKIAATSKGGQEHIGVDGPLAGRLLEGRVKNSGDKLVLGKNLMKVAEAEFAFRMGKALPPRADEYNQDEVLAAVDTLHPAIEIPDSRYADFVTVGAPQLIADNACACWFVLGPATSADWRSVDLVNHEVVAWRNGEIAAKGTGANVLGDPRLALTWLANELRREKIGLRAGDVVTTGTCVIPFAIAPNDKVHLDFGELGSVAVELA